MGEMIFGEMIFGGNDALPPESGESHPITLELY